MSLHHPPLLASGLKFSIGHAVYHATLPSLRRRGATLTPRPGVVVGFTQRFVLVRFDDGTRTRRISPVELVHRGYCENCGQAAELDDTGALVCFWCERPASMPVPADRLPVWENSGDQFHALMIQHMVRTGCTRYDAWTAAHQWFRGERAILQRAA